MPSTVRSCKLKSLDLLTIPCMPNRRVYMDIPYYSFLGFFELLFFCGRMTVQHTCLIEKKII